GAARARRRNALYPSGAITVLRCERRSWHRSGHAAWRVSQSEGRIAPGQAQNAQVASGSLGAEPSRKSQPISALVLVKGQLTSPDEFGTIVLRANPDGSTVRLRDVARIEVGGMGYQFTTRLNGQPTAGLSVL